MNSVQLAWKIRRHGIEMTHLSGGSHIAAVLSVADIIAYLYTNVLRYNVKNPFEKNAFPLEKTGLRIYIIWTNKYEDAKCVLKSRSVL